MNAQELAEKLNKNGFKPIALSEPDKRHDGMIVLSKAVSVQVPLVGDDPNVVRKTDDGEYIFFDSRKSMKSLLADIKDALNDEASDESM